MQACASCQRHLKKYRQWFSNYFLSFFGIRNCLLWVHHLWSENYNFIIYITYIKPQYPLIFIPFMTIDCILMKFHFIHSLKIQVPYWTTVNVPVWTAVDVPVWKEVSVLIANFRGKKFVMNFEWCISTVTDMSDFEKKNDMKKNWLLIANDFMMKCQLKCRCVLQWIFWSFFKLMRCRWLDLNEEIKDERLQFDDCNRAWWIFLNCTEKKIDRI